MAGKLLSIDADAKTVKSRALGFLTAVMYLAPSDVSGFDVCKFASAGCKPACLFSAGRASFDPKIVRARIDRTLLLFQDRAEFWHRLERELSALMRKAIRESLSPAARLNGTSDIPWERLQRFLDLVDRFRDIQFYDYTKYPYHERPAESLPENYDLTFSRSEENERDALISLQNGRRVSVVFSTKKGTDLPSVWRAFPVVDGDATDATFTQPSGVVLGLRAKGKARADRSGFVVQV